MNFYWIAEKISASGHELYKSLLTKDSNIKDLIPVEEYFIMTAIGYSLCSAELGLHEQAAKDLKESFDIWQNFSQTFVKETIFGDKPERFLTKKYAPHIKTEEIASWNGFCLGHGDRIRSSRRVKR